MIKIIQWLLITLSICLSIFLGLSNINVAQTQYQEQTQQQIQKNENIQLVFMDQKINVSNISWVTKQFPSIETLMFYMCPD